MADANFVAVNPALEQRIRNKLITQYNRSDVTANILPKAAGRGKNLAWDIVVGTATGQVFDDGQTVSTFNNDTEVMAQLAWGEYGDAFKITGLAEDAAAGDGTDLGQLFMTKLAQARTRAAEKLNTDLWTGDGTGSPQKILGLTATAGPLDSTGTYANQSRVTYPQWAGNVLANGGVGRALSLGLIEYALEVAFTASGKQPTFGLTTPALWRLLCELAGSERRVNQPVSIRGQTLDISMGFNSVEINGIPIFRDKAATSGTLLLLHEDHIFVEYLPTAASRIERGKVLARVPYAGTKQEQASNLGTPPVGGGPLVGNLIALPAAGNFDNWMLDCVCQLKTDRSNAHVWIKDLLSTAA